MVNAGKSVLKCLKNGSNSGEKFPYPARNSYEVVHYNFCSYLFFRYGFEINP